MKYYTNYEEFKQDVISGRYELDLTNLKYGSSTMLDVHNLPSYITIKDGVITRVRKETQEDLIELLKQDRLDIRQYMPIEMIV